MIRVIAICISLSCLTSVKAQMFNNGSITVSGNALITLHDCDWVNNGTFEAGAGEVLINGNIASSISGTAATAFYNLTIAKAAGNVNLLNDISVNNVLNFQNGLLDLNGKNILLASAASLNGENESTHITGPAGGYVEIIQSLNAPASADPGNLGAVITSSQNLGNTIIRRGHQPQTNAIGIGSSILRYYDITPVNNTSLNATFRFQYFDAELNGLTESDLALWKKPAGSGWTLVGYDSKNTTTNYVEKSGVADFSRWTLSAPGNALPVLWGSISASCENDEAVIRFQTLQEWNTLRFDIERSADNRSWITVATLPAAGNSAVANSYAYTDRQRDAYSNYYRIAQVDVDGTKIYSRIMTVRCGNRTNDMLAYPNPAKTFTNLVLRSSRDFTGNIYIHDAGGRLVKKISANVQHGDNVVRINLTGLAQGTYLVTLKEKDINISQHIVVQ